MKGASKAANGADRQQNMAVFLSPLLWDFHFHVLYRNGEKKIPKSVRKAKSKREVRN